ncbi:ABC transporter permease [Candidatus Aquicultor sp.]
MAIDAIIANKMRSTLTALGIIIGVSAVILLVSVGQGVRSSVTGQIRSIGSNLLYVLPGNMQAGRGPGSGVSNRLRLSMVRQIEQGAAHVLDAGAAVNGTGMVKFGNKERDTTTMNGVTANYAKLTNYNLAEGAFLTDPDINGGRRVAVVGQTIVSDLYNGDSPVGRNISINGQRFTVIGAIEAKGSTLGMDQDDVVFIPITVAQRLLGTDQISQILVEATDENSVDTASDEITRILGKTLKKDDFSVASQQSLLGTVQNITGVMTLMLGGIAGISLIVGGIGIMNIMLVSVTERTREIGIRKAVGAKTHDILMQFVIESATLSVIGGLIGILIGVVGSLVLRALLPSEVTIWSVGLAFFFSAGIGIFFGAYPAFKASRLSPIEALRYE